MNYQRILFTGICGSICFMGLDTLIQGKGFHNYVAAIIGLLFGLGLSYINQKRDKQ